MKESWIKSGFLVLLGVTVGMAGTMVIHPTLLEANSSSTTAEGIVLATGSSQDPAVDLLWAIEGNTLYCLLFGQDHQLKASPKLDLGRAIPRSGKKARFAMVTGKLVGGGVLSDSCYITEAASGVVLMVKVTREGLQVVYTGNLKG